MKYLSSIKDLDANCKYIAIYDDSLTYEDRGEYIDHRVHREERLDFQRILTFNSEKDLTEWIEKKADGRFAEKYKILSVSHCVITTTVNPICTVVVGKN